jgi:acetyl-CoA carboxylase biotin carboxylase subunit
MFRKVLIANRGEIAVRIMRACEERGLRTIAVYSDADRRALHVRRADEAYYIGPAPATESYLRIDRILDAARRSKAEAIHPGYGFLAENAGFAQACADAGVIFVGPPAAAIAAMGDKIAARRCMKQAGVPMVPGTDEGISAEQAGPAAEQLGYPVMVKATAGGGGKGMRLVQRPEEMPAAFAAAQNEARAAFGDDCIYLEKVIEGARHVEFQILADTHGNVIHLGERECSIQRRHQKLIEEAPSVAVNADLRQRMGEVAVRAAKAAGYVNAGTIEFLLDHAGNFYFLEMNTRLQVEHPVTEMITGVDIVKEQLAIASGRRMRYRQEDIVPKGWAIECRITAEDPYNGFLPSSGRVTLLQEPTGPGVRVESGVYEGFEVSFYYDPMIAKLVAWGETRAEAILRMRRALSEYRIGGIHTSIPFHQKIMDHTEFIWGTFDTSFLERRMGGGLAQRPAAGEWQQIAAIAATLVAHERGRQTVTISHGDVRAPSLWKRAARLDGVRR